VRPRAAPWVLYLAAGLATIGVYYLLPANSQGQTFLYDGIGASSAAAVVAGTFLNRPRQRAPWFFFAAGLLAFSVGDVIFNTWLPSSPSLADVFYLGGYPLLAVGLAQIILSLRRSDRRAGLLDAAIFTVGAALCQWIFVMHPLLGDSGSVGARAVALAYPAMDVALLSGLAVFFLTPAWRTVAYRYLVTSLALLLFADEVYGFSPGTYAAETWLDSAWLLSYVLWGVAALHPTMTALCNVRTSIRPRLTMPRLALLAAGLLTAPVVLVVERATARHVQAVPLAIGAAALSLLVLARLAALVSSVDRVRLEERAARAEAESMQRLLAEQNERLREADRLKDEFVALISHDLRTPLTSIMGYLELTLDDANLSAEQRGYLEVVSRNSDRLLRLVNDLLFVARLEAGQHELRLTDIDLAATAAQLVDELAPRAAANDIELTCEAEPVAPVQADRGRMFQLLENLISNAIKFTPKGGRICVRVRDGGGNVGVDVIDSGIGITADEQRLLFERFFRATSARDRHIPGTGLGLYIARAIVEAHGGEITVTSEPRVGTTFSVRLPVERAARAELVS
jgi:signal transduction histidine kinase